MIDRKLSMQCVAGHIAESFKTDPFFIWSEENSEKLVIRGSPNKDDEVWAPSRKTFFYEENTMLMSVSLPGVKDFLHSTMLSPLQEMEAYEWSTGDGRPSIFGGRTRTWEIIKELCCY